MFGSRTLEGYFVLKSNLSFGVYYEGSVLSGGFMPLLYLVSLSWIAFGGLQVWNFLSRGQLIFVNVVCCASLMWQVLNCQFPILSHFFD